MVGSPSGYAGHLDSSRAYTSRSPKISGGDAVWETVCTAYDDERTRVILSWSASHPLDIFKGKLYPCMRKGAHSWAHLL